MSEITYTPWKPGMSIKPGESVFVFIDGVTVETFQKDEEFRSGTVSSLVAGKVRVEWDDLVKVVRGGRTELVRSYEYIARDRFTRIERGTWVLDHKSDVSVSPEKSADAAGPDEKSELTETPDVPVQRRSSRSSGKAEKAEKA